MENIEELNKENKHSITLKKNAKGDYYWDIKLYFDSDIDGVVTVNKIKEIDTQLKLLFD